MDNQDTVGNIMTKALFTVNLDDDLYRVYELMRKHNVRHLPVVAGKKLVGIVSQTDILRLSFGHVFEGEEHVDAGIFEMLKLEQVMATNPKTVLPSCTVEALGRLFVGLDFHALPVVTRTGDVVGIVTTTDLIAYFLGQVYPGLPDAG